MKKLNFLFIAFFSLSLFFISCDGEDGRDGIDGIDGVDGVDGVDGQDGADGQDGVSPAMVDAAGLLLASIAADGGVPYDADNPALTFTEDQNVFLPSVLGLDFRIDRSVVPAGPTARFPMFQGWEIVDGQPRELYYIITEASDRGLARLLGVIFAPRMADAIGSTGEQNSQWSDDGRLIFEGTVDFSPTRNLVPGGASEDGLLLAFPPAEVTPGAVADENWSSYVVLPGTDVVINAQPVANSTGIHDRIPNPNGNSQADEDDLNNPNFAPDQASVVMQLLDGWQDGRPYYFHIVTDTSDPAPATIELGVFAPKLANLPTFGLFPGGAMLPFSPTANGILPEANNPLGFQGLNTPSSGNRQANDPTNTFPIDPLDPNYAPMWDAHITEFTVPPEERVILTSFDQINDLLADGTLVPFRGNANPRALANSLSDMLTATGAIINCPVIAQPFPAAIGDIIGDPTNN